MIVRTLAEVEAAGLRVMWGNGTSHRLLTEADGMGFSVCHTLVRAGSVSRLEYKNHLEACYCIEGEGEIEDAAGRVFPLRPGTIYALDRNDPHTVRCGTKRDMVLVSVFAPALKGHEVHDLSGAAGSGY